MSLPVAATGREEELRILVAIGSRHDRVCSVGAFARAEASALQRSGGQVEVLEPTAAGEYPRVDSFQKTHPPVDVVLFHSPALHDRKRPWNPLVSAMRLRRAFSEALFIPIVHEYSEAPFHWRLRQKLIVRFADGVVVNSAADQRMLGGAPDFLLRVPLGPTLFYSELLAEKTSAGIEKVLAPLHGQVRDEVFAKLNLPKGEKLILHPGLLTPGKGIEFLQRLAPLVAPGRRLVLMGGKGPKQKDIDFADSVIAELRSRLGDRLIHLDSPDDEEFRRMLLASDLVVLPYDNGVSERRSSFLSSMCCGANVWTTTGPFSAALRLDGLGPHCMDASVWKDDVAAASASIDQAMSEDAKAVMARRVRNVIWAAPRSWQARVQELLAFIGSRRRRLGKVR